MTMANETNINGGSKGHSSMQVQLRRRLSLLSRASTLAIIAAAGGLGSVQQAQAAPGCGTLLTGPGNQTISSNVTCAQADGVTPGVSDNGDVTINDNTAVNGNV